MNFFCPNCGYTFYLCSNCGFNIKKFKKPDFVSKLIKALTHKSGEIQHFALEILAQKKSKRAIPFLKKILKKTKDPLLKIKIKKVLYKIK